MLFFVVPNVIVCGIYVAIVWLLLKLLAMTPWTAAIWIMGGLAVALVIYSAATVIWDCAAEPIFYPPECPDEDACGIGRMEYACDGPAGGLAYIYARAAAPITALICSILTYRVATGARRKKQEA